MEECMYHLVKRPYEPGNISLGFSDLCTLVKPEAIIKFLNFNKCDTGNAGGDVLWVIVILSKVLSFTGAQSRKYSLCCSLTKPVLRIVFPYLRIRPTS
jgi:hypothetical protein